jgi:hypothetical protein
VCVWCCGCVGGVFVVLWVCVDVCVWCCVVCVCECVCVVWCFVYVFFICFTTILLTAVRHTNSPFSWLMRFFDKKVFSHLNVCVCSRACVCV